MRDFVTPHRKDAGATREIQQWTAAAGFASQSVILAAEEPLAIDIRYGPKGSRTRLRVATTLRTPGADVALAIGWCVGEGILREPKDYLTCYVTEPRDGLPVVCIDLHPDCEFDPTKHRRLSTMTSACGLCGKELLEAAELETPLPKTKPVTADVLVQLAGTALAQQILFRETGGVHAAAIFHRNGELHTLAEDVGRHNAVDKVIGGCFLHTDWVAAESILFVSGRAGYELVQKSARAGIPILVAVGAPTTLSVAFAERAGLTLLGFARDNRFTIYTGRERVDTPI